MPVCTGLLTDWRVTTFGATLSNGLRLRGLDGALPVHGDAERVHDASQHAVTDRHLCDAPRRADLRAFLDAGVRTEDDRSDSLFLKVQCDADSAGGEFD